MKRRRSKPAGSRVPNAKSAIRNPQSAIPLVSSERVKTYIRSRFNPIRGLTPELLSQYLDSFRAGFLRQAVLIWQEIEDRDDTLSSVVPKRKKAVSRNGWEIVLVDTKGDRVRKAAADRQKEVLESFWNGITVTDCLDADRRGEVSLLVNQMADALGKKYAVHEIVWSARNGNLSAEFRFAPLWFFEATTGKLRFLPSDSAIYGQDLEPDRWLVTVAEKPLMLASSVAYVYKNLSLKDWVIYSERHGMPGIHGKTNATKDSSEWNDMADAIENFASDWSILTSGDAEINPVDLGARGQLPYPPLVDRMSRAMSAIWRGADLSTMSAGLGAGEGASLQGKETDVLEGDDCAWISETLSRSIDRRVLEYHFGPGVEPLAYIRLKTSTRQNVDQDLKIDQALQGMGMPVSAEALAERYHRSIPAGDETILAPRPSPGIPPFAANRKPPVSIPSSPMRHAPCAMPSSLPNASAPDSGFLSAALQQTAQALAEDLAPLRARIEAILAIQDPEYFFNAVRNLQKELPGILLAAGKDPAAAKALEETFAASLLNGYAEGGAA